MKNEKLMKTNKTSSLVLTIMNLLILAIFVSACGKKNTSGKRSSSRNRSINYSNTNRTFGNLGSSSAIINRLLQERQCAYGGGRILVQKQVQINVPLGSVAAGVTSIGDVAELVSQGNVGIVRMYLCQRQSFGGGYPNTPIGGVTNSQLQASILSAIPAMSYTCQVNELYMDVRISSPMGIVTPLLFRAIDLDRPSALCRN